MTRHLFYVTVTKRYTFEIISTDEELDEVLYYQTLEQDISNGCLCGIDVDTKTSYDHYSEPV